MATLHSRHLQIFVILSNKQLLYSACKSIGKVILPLNVENVLFLFNFQWFGFLFENSVVRIRMFPYLPEGVQVLYFGNGSYASLMCTLCLMLWQASSFITYVLTWLTQRTLLRIPSIFTCCTRQDLHLQNTECRRTMSLQSLFVTDIFYNNLYLLANGVKEKCQEHLCNRGNQKIGLYG